jgi:Domain of unknown function (DUF4893)
MRRIWILGLAAILAAGPSFADGELDKILTAADKARLSSFDQVKAEALKAAKQGGTPADVKILDAALAGPPKSMSGSYSPIGTWRCRTIKLGGSPPLTVYGWFKCRISDDGAGWMLEKLTGSQKTKGRFYTASDKRLIYVGAGYVNGEKPRKYGDSEQENQIAVAERLSDRRLMLQFPSPAYESQFDLLALER